jgi:ABC-type multidrug transport system ATPase subunit
MLLQFEKLSKFYSQTCALRDASGEIKFGEKILITGHNGSGKTTLLRLLSGQLYPSTGKVLADGKPLVSGTRQFFSVLSENKFAYPDLTLEENLKLYLPSQVELHEAKRLGEEFEISLTKSEPFKNLSSGQKQKFGIIKALSKRNEVLFLDEPLNFLDSSSKIKLVELLNGVTQTVVLISHEVDFFSTYRKMNLKAGVIECL